MEDPDYVSDGLSSPWCMHNRVQVHNRLMRCALWMHDPVRVHMTLGVPGTPTRWWSINATVEQLCCHLCCCLAQGDLYDATYQLIIDPLDGPWRGTPRVFNGEPPPACCVLCASSTALTPWSFLLARLQSPCCAVSYCTVLPCCAVLCLAALNVPRQPSAPQAALNDGQFRAAPPVCAGQGKALSRELLRLQGLLQDHDLRCKELGTSGALERTFAGRPWLPGLMESLRE